MNKNTWIGGIGVERQVTLHGLRIDCLMRWLVLASKSRCYLVMMLDTVQTNVLLTLLFPSLGISEGGGKHRPMSSGTSHVRIVTCGAFLSEFRA